MTDWIKCEDRLPEIGQEFLGYCDGDIDHYLRVEDCVWNRNSSNKARKDLFEVLSHWMPTPEPPEDQ